jgi:thiol-disulfide isomerase/thioredoxin
VTLGRSIVLLLLSLVVLAASVAANRSGDARNGAETRAGVPDAQPRPLEVGPSEWLAIPAPDVPFVTVHGEAVRLSEYRGRVVLLNFWGTWCPPCRVEIPHLVQAQQRLIDLGGTIVAPAVGSGSPEEILEFAAGAGINYPIWIVSDAVAVTRFGAPGYPFTMLIGPDGIVRRTYIGPQTEDVLLTDVELLLSGASSEPSAGG